MATQRGTQRQCSKSGIASRRKSRNRKGKRSRWQRLFEDALLWLMIAAADFFILYLMFFAEDPGLQVHAQAETQREKRYAINSDYMIPADEYDQYLEDREAQLGEQARIEMEGRLLPTEMSAPAETEAIQTEPETTAQAMQEIGAALVLSQADQDILKRIAMAEAESEDTEGKALVMCVVMNRTQAEGFPDTIEGVVTQPGQFTPVSDGRFYSAVPNADCDAALQMLFDYWDGSQGATYFICKPSDGSPTWHSTHLQELFTHGAHTFYREY